MASGWIEKDAAGFKSVVRMPNGRRRAKRFAKRADAKTWLTEQQAQIDRGTFIDPKLGRMKFGEWVAEFRSGEVQSLRPSTNDQNERAIANYLLPAFKNVQLDKITARNVQSWVNDLAAGGLAPSSVAKYYQILHKILAAAVDAGLLGRNPCHAGIKRPKKTHTEMRFLDAKQVGLLAKKMEPRYRALVFVAGYGGLRLSELAGLRRSRVLEDAVDVREIAVEVNGRIYFGPPKTRRGARTVPLPDQVSAILQIHLDKYVPDDPSAFVFGTPTGTVLRAASWRSRYLNPAATAAKLGTVAPHDLRHTAIAIWIAAQVPVKEIADRAGHASVATILDTYGHLFPDSSDSFRERVGGLFVP